MKKLLLALLLSVSNVVSAQTIDPTTGSVETTTNIINNTQWQNVIYMNGSQLSQVEGTGGGPTPAFNTDTNTIRFSYLWQTAYQVQAINSVLANQGIKVSGYNWAWTIYNPGASLYGEIYILDKKDAVIDYNLWNYSGQNINWQRYSGTRNFSQTYVGNELGNLAIGFTGVDALYWSGYYGPRVRDVSVTFNFASATTTPTAPTTTTVVAPSDIVVTPEVQVVSEPIIQTVIAPLVVSSPVVETQSTQPTVTATVAAPTSTGKGLSQSEAVAFARAVQKSVAAQTNSIVSASIENSISIGNSQAETAATSSTSSTNNTSTTQTQQRITVGSNLVQQEQSMSNQRANVDITRPGELVLPGLSDIPQRPGVTEFVSATDETNPTSVRNLIAMLNYRQQQLEEQERKANEILASQNKPELSELSGTTTLASMQVVPVGFNVYTQFMLKDVAFYAPKEIYRGQVNVDNARSMRALNFASELKHQEMVNQQYGEKK